MAIKGLTDKRRLPRVGKIHLGVKVKSEKTGGEHPKAVDYFVFPEDHPQYEELKATFGDQPKELLIVLPTNNEEQFASQFYRCYSKTRGLICKGDGETCMRTVDTVTGALADRDSKNTEMKQMTCNGRDCPDYQAKKCHETMCFQFLLPQITGLGIWQIDTSSINTIRNINGALALIRAVHGRVAMLPLLLTIEQIDVIPPETGKKKKAWVLNLTSPTTLVEAAKQSMIQPLRLLAGIGPEGVVTPVPDDERPELTTFDWEGPQGDPVDPKVAALPVKESDLWPPGPEDTKPHDFKTGKPIEPEAPPEKTATKSDQTPPEAPESPVVQEAKAVVKEVKEKRGAAAKSSEVKQEKAPEDQGKEGEEKQEKSSERAAAEAQVGPAEEPQRDEHGHILTFQALLNWCMAHSTRGGTQYDRSWFFRNTSFQEAELLDKAKGPANVKAAYAEVKEWTGWED